jgi:hypothetical protein
VNRPKSLLGTNPTGPWTNGTLTNLITGPSGTTTFYLRSSQVGQQEVVVACPQRWDGICGTTNVIVGYQDIYYVEEKPEWVHVGFTSEHGGSNAFNHWMTSNAAYMIWYTTTNFRAQFPDVGRIAINDMSLPFGGIFDLKQNWQGSHFNHSRGTSVDVRNNGGPNSVPHAHTRRFMDGCGWFGATIVLLEDEYGSNRHIHCQWPNPN